VYVFVGFSRIYLLGILVFKGLTVRRLYKSLSISVNVVPIQAMRFSE
jgi:hypothetical protein